MRLAYDYVSTRQDAATVLAIYDPEIEWDISRAPARHLLGEPHVFRGHDGLKKFFSGVVRGVGRREARP